jgi:hypothetical protein
VWEVKSLQQDSISEPSDDGTNETIAAYQVPVPFPILWWSTEPVSDREKRTAMDAVMLICQSEAQAYRHELLDHLLKNGYLFEVDNASHDQLDIDGSNTIVSGTGAGLIAVEERHRAFVDGITAPFSKAFDPERHSGLLDWWLTYGWFSALFSAFRFRPSGVDELVSITNPAEFALPYADAAVVMLNRCHGALIAEIGSSIVEANRAFDAGPPPWDFVSIAQRISR